MKLSRLAFLFFFTYGITGCSSQPTEKIGNSEKYSKEEISSAVNEVVNSYNQYLDNGKLLSIEYDEEESNQLVIDYLPMLNISYQNKENIIFLNSTIKTGEAQGALDSYTKYDNYYWVLEGPKTWEIIYAGFKN
ncbi:hypothetical protein [Candidatus Enterococcus leclercqii]|uniref:hypothetical protein n=1 Tax=Candidatus Enterococcus leclercqii TaxID=1857218 RepID=UPI00137981BB|nr:hypothetical protein [Enterococcus sp. CU9D]KAF1294199.1 hypothetical protein BAU14_07360 [Enterococcus sp. CU9D]